MTSDRYPTDEESLLFGAGWTARRLGIAPATLRTWHYRYGVAPTARSAGGHRRYSVGDVSRLERMRRLILEGMPVGVAAQLSQRGDRGEGRMATPVRRGHRRHAGRPREVSGLIEVTTALDQPSVADLLAVALRAKGVEHTWDHLVVPVLEYLGECYGRHGDCVDSEHLFSTTVTAALSGFVGRRRADTQSRPILLAAPDQEQHVLALYAVAAGLAESRTASRVLGASVPAEALAASARRLAPQAVFLWSQSEATARRDVLDALPRRRPAARVVVGGPGWVDNELPDWVRRVNSLGAALDALGGAPRQ